MVVVGKEGCMPCITVRRLLEDLRVEIPSLVVKEIDLASKEGLDLAVKHSILYPPAVFIRGSLFARGKVYPEKLKEAIRKEAGGN